MVMGYEFRPIVDNYTELRLIGIIWRSVDVARDIERRDRVYTLSKFVTY
jgi:hypothetical protein